ncbi:hypothetical protein L195_g011246 [Trifolium pratense]|uniref:Uncharacterized protein n=1 Tax=Trifolium pratense TaxID=57577 RepID=A0A2K3PGZ9_TRIPR|nr:hypothetical protein L195_g011246 [Trifolium pratense]
MFSRAYPLPLESGMAQPGYGQIHVVWRKGKATEKFLNIDIIDLLANGIDVIGRRQRGVFLQLWTPSSSGSLLLFLLSNATKINDSKVHNHKGVCVDEVSQLVHTREDWKKDFVSILTPCHILKFGGIQSIGSGVLHAFGRLLVLEYAPAGKEGVFCVWYGWVRVAGLCLGFTVASVVPGQIKTSFGVAFVAALVGIVVLLFGNIDHNNSENGSNGNDNLGLDSKESVGV